MGDDVKNALQKRRGSSSVDDDFSGMFGLESSIEADIVQIPIRQLVDYENQPFRPYDEESLQKLADSISEHGLLNPISVRKLADGKYQILAGRNRKNACALLSWESIPAKLLDCDADDAALIMLSSNLNQRQKLLHSEKAFAYKMQMDILKRQGKRTDLEVQTTSTQSGWKSESASKIAESSGTSKNDIRRHIHLTFLLPELLQSVDKELLSFIVGYNLSFLSKGNQRVALEWLNSNGFQISVKQSEKIRKIALEGDLSIDALNQEFSPAAHAVKERPLRVSREKFKGYEDLIPSSNADFEVLFTEFLNWLRNSKTH
jgi:ParB family chromosome partitioning protein